MQNLPILSPAMPPSVNAVASVAVPDTASASAPDGENFSAVLARELTAKAIKPKSDTALPDAATGDSQIQQPESEVAPPQLPSDPALVAPALLALMPGIQPDERVFGDSRQVPGKALPAALSTETLAQRNLPQAAVRDRPTLESDDTADFAAPGRFPPLAAAEAKTSRSATGEQVTQRLTDVAPVAQVANPSIGVVAPLASASAPTTQDLKLDIRVGAPGWNGELAQKVVWMATQQQQVAELRLNPPHLGPVEVMLTLGNDQGAQASIQFASPHVAAREAIEAALPRLREMMADSGIALGNVTVSADSFQQQAEAGRQDRSWLKRPADMSEAATGLAARPAATLIRSGRNGLVDTFA